MSTNIETFYSNGFPTWLPVKQKNLYQEVLNLLAKVNAQDEPILNAVKRQLSESLLAHKDFKDCQEIVSQVQSTYFISSDNLSAETEQSILQIVYDILIPQLGFSFN